METKQLEQILTSFQESSSAVRALDGNLDKFSGILAELDKKMEIVEQLRSTLIDQKVMNTLSNTSNAVKVRCEQIRDEMKQAGEQLDEINQSSQSYSASMEGAMKRLSELTQSLDECKKLIKHVNAVSDSIQKVVNLNLVETMNGVVDVSRSALDTISNTRQEIISSNQSLEEKVTEAFKTVKQDTEKQKAMISGFSDTLRQQYELVQTDNQKLVNEMSNVVSTNLALQEIMKELRQQNIDARGEFYKLCDQWAGESIRGIAIKKRK